MTVLDLSKLLVVPVKPAEVFSKIKSILICNKCLIYFRWAWQNPHITLHIAPETRLVHATQKKRSGHPKRPPHSMLSLLSNLHLLLRVPSFARWPLSLRFFAPDVHKAWIKYCKTAEPLRPSLPVIEDFPPVDAKREPSTSLGGRKRKRSHGIEALDIVYSEQKPHVEKARDIVAFEREGTCAVCSKELDHDGGIYTICPAPECEAVSHITCLSRHFLQQDPNSAGTSLVPIQGHCPSCKTELKWIQVVKELTLRVRGQKIVEKLLKKPKTQKTKATKSSQRVAESSSDDTGSDSEVSDINNEEEEKLRRDVDDHALKADFGDSWHVIDSSDDSDSGSVTSSFSNASKPPKAAVGRVGQERSLPAVIEDSDYDDLDLVA